MLDAGLRMLERLGYSVLTAKNGEEAISVYTDHKDEIALILTDTVMPKMGGQELYETLVKVNPNVKVLLMSGYSLKTDVSELLEKGLRGFVQKPFSYEGLAEAVRKVLDE